MSGKLYPFVTTPGIQRDGTSFASKQWIDGQWVRFQRGLPRKIGGYKQILGNLPNVPRGIYVTPNVPNFSVYIGDFQSIKYQNIDQFGTPVGGLVDRTPITLIPNVNNVWGFDMMFDTNSNTDLIFVHSPPNLNSIFNNVESQVFYGNIATTTPLLPLSQEVSGGLAVFQPYLFLFGNSGDVRWSAPSKPLQFVGGGSGRARVSAQKIVAGIASRGGNSSPAGILWSLNSVIRVTFVGGEAVFRFDTITSESSILSSRSIVEYDGIFFWCGIDRFLFTSGAAVQEIPNDTNLNYFFSSLQKLNYSQRQKIWGTKVPEYGEIWWFYPSGNNTECDRAIIFNKRENSWYDALLNRGAGYFEQVFADPIWSDSQPNNLGEYGIWIHDIGLDQDINGTLTAINSYIESGSLAWCAIGPTGQWTGVDRYIDLERFEPDFILSGSLSLTVNGREYANSPVISSNPYIFNNATVKIDLREQRREMTLKFQSNEVGGFFELGQCILWMRVGDART